MLRLRLRLLRRRVAVRATEVLSRIREALPARLDAAEEARKAEFAGFREEVALARRVGALAEYLTVFPKPVTLLSRRTVDEIT